MPHPHDGGGLSALSRGSSGSTASASLFEKIRSNPLGKIGLVLESIIAGSKGEAPLATKLAGQEGQQGFERRRLEVLEGQFAETKAENKRKAERQEGLDKEKALDDKARGLVRQFKMVMGAADSELSGKEIEENAEQLREVLPGVADAVARVGQNKALRAKVRGAAQALNSGKLTEAQIEAVVRGALAETDGNEKLASELAAGRVEKLVDKIEKEPKPNIQNFLNPKDNTVIALDLSKPDQREKADRLLERGFVKVGLEGTPKDLGPAGQQRLGAQSDFFQVSIDLADRVIAIGEKDPTKLGAVGKVRQVGQSVAGALRDAGLVLSEDFVAPSRQILEDSGIEAEGFFDDPDIPELKLLENSLGIALARLRTPLSQDRVTTEVVRRSIDDIGLTKVRSGEDVLRNMKIIRDQFQRAVSDIRKRQRQGRRETERLRFDAQGNRIQ